MAAATALPIFSPAAAHKRGGSLLPPLRYIKAPSSFKFDFYNVGVSVHNRDAIRKINYTTVTSAVKIEVEEADEACELVNGSEIVIGEGKDSIRAYLLKAVKNNNGTGILLLSDIFGFADSSTRDFAYRVACTGYNVLVPDIFRRNPWKKNKSKTEFEQWLETHPSERVARDINLSAKWISDEFIAAGLSTKIGIIGFCYGGGKLIETLARDDHSYFGTGVCIYGTRMSSSVANYVKAPVLFISGDNDPLCSTDLLKEMKMCIEDSEVAIYSGRGHAFVHRPESHEDDRDAEDAFMIMRNWLHEKLVVCKE